MHRRAERHLPSGIVLPRRMSEPGPETIVSPTVQPLRVHDVTLLAVRVLHQRDARRTVRIVLDRVTVAVTPDLSRLKSMTRYFRLWPPPRRRIEM